MLPLAPFALAAAVAEPAPWLDEAEEEIEVVELDDEGGETYSWCYKKALLNGVQLPDNPTLYKRWHADESWGTPEMIEVITTAAEELAWLLPEADPIVVGDISTRRGGRLDGHKSHRGGVDADLGLFWGDGKMYLSGFRDVSPSDLDAEANWLFIRAMLETGHVERILLDRSLVDALRRYTIREGHLSREEAQRIFPVSGYGEIWRSTGIVHHAPGHRHHMHVRVNCPVLE